VLPSPVKPSLQAQVNEPGVLVHVALVSQSSCSSSDTRRNAAKMRCTKVGVAIGRRERHVIQEVAVDEVDVPAELDQPSAM
jgi:hypothetical protein